MVLSVRKEKMDNWKKEADDYLANEKKIQEEIERKDLERKYYDHISTLKKLVGQKLANEIIEREIKPNYKLSWKEETLRKQIEIICRLEKFKCRICGHPALIPKSYPGSGSGGPFIETNYDYPGNLFRCKDCGNWFCERHFHEGYCQNYWDKKLKRRRKRFWDR